MEGASDGASEGASEGARDGASDVTTIGRRGSMRICSDRSDPRSNGSEEASGEAAPSGPCAVGAEPLKMATRSVKPTAVVTTILPLLIETIFID